MLVLDKALSYYNASELLLRMPGRTQFLSGPRNVIWLADLAGPRWFMHLKKLH